MGSTIIKSELQKNINNVRLEFQKEIQEINNIKDNLNIDINKLNAEFNNLRMEFKKEVSTHDLLKIEHCKLENLMIGICDLISVWKYETKNNKKQETNLKELSKEYLKKEENIKLIKKLGENER